MNVDGRGPPAENVAPCCVRLAHPSTTTGDNKKTSWMQYTAEAVTNNKKAESKRNKTRARAHTQLCLPLC